MAFVLWQKLQFCLASSHGDGHPEQPLHPVSSESQVWAPQPPVVQGHSCFAPAVQIFSVPQ
jgi:hypothetical protein